MFFDFLQENCSYINIYVRTIYIYIYKGCCSKKGPPPPPHAKICFSTLYNLSMENLIPLCISLPDLTYNKWPSRNSLGDIQYSKHTFVLPLCIRLPYHLLRHTPHHPPPRADMVSKTSRSRVWVRKNIENVLKIAEPSPKPFLSLVFMLEKVWGGSWLDQGCPHQKEKIRIILVLEIHLARS